MPRKPFIAENPLMKESSSRTFSSESQPIRKFSLRCFVVLYFQQLNFLDMEEFATSDPNPPLFSLPRHILTLQTRKT